MAGFIYIMSNPSFADGRIKIGKSDRDPEEFRKSELNSTGVPEPFRVEYSAYVQDHHEIEKNVHRHFLEHRPNINREFFTCSIMDAISAIQNIAGETLKHEDNYYAEYERLKREREEREAANKQAKQIKEDEREKKREELLGRENERKKKEIKKIRRESKLYSLQKDFEYKASDALKIKLSIDSLAFHKPLTGKEQILGLLTFPISMIWILKRHHNENKADVEYEKEREKAYKIIETEISEIRKNLEHSKDWEKDFSEQKSSFEIKMRQLIANLS